MTTTINTDGATNKYIGYAGDLTDIASGNEIKNQITNFLNSFPNISADTDFLTAWRTDETSISGNNGSSIGNGFFGVKLTVLGTTAFVLNSKDAGTNNSDIAYAGSHDDFSELNRAVAYSNGVDLGAFAWEFDNSNQLLRSQFHWAGEVKGNSNISSPQNRCGIFISMSSPSTIDKIGSSGVKQGDSTTKRIHLDTQAGANHLIDCGTDTGRLYLIEDDGAGGDGGAVGYCENLYLSKKAGLTVGGFVTLDGITDGGSEQGIVVGQWGDSAHLIMRVYDGVN